MAWTPDWEALVPRAGASAGQQIAAQGGTAEPSGDVASPDVFVPIDFRSPADRGANAGGAVVSWSSLLTSLDASLPTCNARAL